MELKSKNLLVLDACSIINLLYIDFDHEIIFKNLNDYFEFYISEKVINEIRNNALVRADFLRSKKSITTREYQDLTEYINITLGELYSNVFTDRTLKDLYSESVYDDIHDIIGGRENKGEWYSIALSLFISRYKMSRLAFITDDLPAKDQYYSVIRNQNIGLIEDTSDFFTLMYWLCPNIDQQKFHQILQDLYAQYASGARSLGKEIKNFRSHKVKPSNRKLDSKLSNLQYKLERLEIENIHDLRDKILLNAGKHVTPLKIIFNKNNKVFEATTNKSLLNNIRTKIDYSYKKSIFKVF